ncbi:hypothetical protein H5410_041016 [Solanum commersonii]|uniref:Uncharacterized protein n=1 Tax=Solanum commersonii TaxID=4109 RepID=A0A9J5XU86_SOLCO|nr:hypothetical protein H5410_041016 [Solanum commersonii]
MDGQPTYMMSLFPLPVNIEKKFNKARRVFLWQGNKEKKGYNLGSLGIKKLRAHNESLLKKWLWRFCCEEMALWRRFISQKYGLLNSWIIEEVTSTLGCSVWKTIRRLWLSFSNNMKYKRFCGEDMALWRGFISQKYELLNSWITEEVTGTLRCSVWKIIRRLWLSFSNNLKYKIGTGEKTNF